MTASRAWWDAWIRVRPIAPDDAVFVKEMLGIYSENAQRMWLLYYVFGESAYGIAMLYNRKEGDVLSLIRAVDANMRDRERRWNRNERDD